MVQRGEVYVIQVELPRAPTGSGEFDERSKLFLILSNPGVRDVVGVFCNTKRPETRAPRAGEVEVGVAEGFAHVTVIDCRYPFTFPGSAFEGMRPTVRLSQRVMEEVNEALAVGLGMI